MNIEAFREYCLIKKGVTEAFPFDESTLVFKVGGKLFALTDITQFVSVNLKCDPERAIELRERYNGVKPGWHKKNRQVLIKRVPERALGINNTVSVDSDVPEPLLRELIDHSYNAVINSLPKKLKNELQA